MNTNIIIDRVILLIQCDSELLLTDALVLALGELRQNPRMAEGSTGEFLLSCVVHRVYAGERGCAR